MPKTLTRIRAVAAAVLLLLPLAGAAAAQSPARTSPEGEWATARGEGRVRIESCADKLCGFIVDSDRPNGRGRALLMSFQGGPEIWRDGTIIDPKTGRRYSGRLALTAPDQLTVTGCLAPPFCASQVWRRAGS